MFTALLLALAAPPADWKTDELVLATGAVVPGLLADDSPAGIRFVWVVRRPGRPTVTYTSVYARHEVKEIRRLSDADRAALREKLAELDAAKGGERQRIDELVLAPADWLGQPGKAVWYTSEQFTLLSAAPEEVTRRAAVRLEQIHTAYTRFFPPRADGRPVSIVLAADRASYRAALGPATGPVLNPAVYDPALNRIVCGTDLGTLGTDLAAARQHAARQLASVAKYEAEVLKLYKDDRLARDRYKAEADRQRQRVWLAEKANGRAFDAATDQLFRLLYHETFHAYAAGWAFPQPPAGPGELPRWLNEGLAQVFETAVLDGYELRVGHPDRDRLDRVQGLLKAGPGLVPLTELLKTGRDGFLATHADQKAAADRTYLSCWAVAYHLLFARRAVGGPAFDAYLAAAGADPVAAFEKLVGTDAAGYEAELKAFFPKLAPDGTVRK